MTEAVSAKQEEYRRSRGLPEVEDTHRWLRKRQRTPLQWGEAIPLYEPLERSGDLEGAIAYYKGFGMREAERSFGYVRLVSPRRWKRLWWTLGILLALPTLGGSLVFAVIMIALNRASEERAVIEISAVGDGPWTEDRRTGIEKLRFL